MRYLAVFLSICLASFSGCEPKPSNSSSEARPAKFKPINPDEAVFWDRQTTENAALLRDIAADFNAGRTGLKIKIEQTGGYTDIFRKVSASIQAGVLPSMAVAYASMTTEYVYADAVVPLDPFINDAEIGLAPGELEDFFPAVIESNRFPQFGDRLYSFPFCKSVLVLYFNKDVLAAAGIEEPPKTWEAFLAQCRRVKERTGRHAYAINVDCSTVVGIIYSLGGEVFVDGQTQFDSAESAAAFEIYETLVREKLAYQIPPRTYDDDYAFAHGRIAFKLGSSSAKPYIDQLMESKRESWGIAPLPQEDPGHPKTVLYGPNIVIFNTTPEHQRAAWQFAKFFASPETVARWASNTGYVPFRKSTAQNPAIKAYWEQGPYNRVPFDCLEFARPEPNVAAWQEVRILVERALTAVLTRTQTAREAATELKKEADEALEGARRSAPASP